MDRQFFFTANLLSAAEAGESGGTHQREPTRVPERRLRILSVNVGAVTVSRRRTRARKATAVVVLSVLALVAARVAKNSAQHPAPGYDVTTEATDEVSSRKCRNH